VTPAYLERATKAYLERFASRPRTCAGCCAAGRQALPPARRGPAEFAEAVDEVVARAIRSGLVDDTRYAEARVATLRRRGGSARAIQAKLAQKGLPGAAIEAALEGEPEDEIAAAHSLARRRSSGPTAPASAGPIATRTSWSSPARASPSESCGRSSTVSRRSKDPRWRRCGGALDSRRNNRTRETSMIRKARAVWRGAGKDGTGHLTSDSGVLRDTPYTFKTRFESEPGTNPEELIAAAHAGCFSMALAFQLQGAGFTPTELATECAISLAQEGGGFKITKSALTLRAQRAGHRPGEIRGARAGGREELPGLQGAQRRNHHGFHAGVGTASTLPLAGRVAPEG
jgi:osmotically inducible protein OsmC